MSIHDCKPWWKQKPVAARAPMMLGGNHDDATTVCCFICKRPEQKPQSCGNMPCNSLLSYFSTISSGTSSGTMTAAAMDTKPVDTHNKTMSLLQKCTFCDRTACPSCTRQCEECHFHFCSLCSTANYSGPYERSYCLDCNNNTANRQEHDDDTNDMNIG